MPGTALLLAKLTLHPTSSTTTLPSGISVRVLLHRLWAVSPIARCLEQCASSKGFPTHQMSRSVFSQDSRS
ncbi:hypothetical protein QBC39DRAFT_356917 [Podospora conica]|nr:hypothetical protein QBC39DRAFT_356917 [Schizothecium conicum]